MSRSCRQIHVCEWVNESFFMQPGQVLSEVVFDSALPLRNCRQRGKLLGGGQRSRRAFAAAFKPYPVPANYVR
jgi:hypothetical protein